MDAPGNPLVTDELDSITRALHARYPGVDADELRQLVGAVHRELAGHARVTAHLIPLTLNRTRTLLLTRMSGPDRPMTKVPADEEPMPLGRATDATRRFRTSVTPAGRNTFMKLNATANWTLYFAAIALVALNAVTLTAAGTELWSLAIASGSAMVAVIVVAASIVAATAIRSRRATNQATVTQLRVPSRPAGQEAA